MYYEQNHRDSMISTIEDILFRLEKREGSTNHGGFQVLKSVLIPSSPVSTVSPIDIGGQGSDNNFFQTNIPSCLRLTRECSI